jgi:predicted O-linked N-acetylglucosamine transferase (SPINDLY family)
MNSTHDLMARATQFHQQGQFPQAEQLYQQVLTVEPDHPHALYQWGVLTLQSGRPEQALQLLTAAVHADRSQPRFYLNLGEAHRRLAQWDEALKAYQRAASLQPNFFEAQASLGSLYLDLGHVQEAIACFRQVVKLAPEDVQVRALLGRALCLNGQWSDAESCFRRVVRTTPQQALAHYNLGAVLQSQGRLAEAEACYRQAILLSPHDAPAHNNLGSVLQQRGESTEAEAHYRAALAVSPRYASARSNLGALLIEAFRHEEALVQCQAALELAPQAADVQGNLANALACLGRVDEAVANYRQAIALAPRHAKLHGDLLYLLNFCPGLEGETLFAEHRAWGRRHADPLTADSKPHTNDRSPARKLRIGYVSPYFTDHAVNFFVEPVLSSHNREQCEIFAYSDVAVPNATPRRLQSFVDGWRDTTQLNDEQLSELVRRDQIDILVDLTGHIGGSRLLAFARRPAPVQVTYIGYQNTTGMQAMDYRLTDGYADPAGQTDSLHTERLVRLPRSFFCYQPSPEAPPVEPLPALRGGYVTFGSFNNFQKIHSEVLEAWAGILRQVERARLVMIVGHAPQAAGRVHEFFAAHGIERQRIDLVPRLSREEYLQRIASVDIALDPFPFNGHTTTCDCLWQGVPVVTLSGQTYLSRFGGSGLATLGLDDWIASSKEQYVAIAVAKAADLPGLSSLRESLRQRMAASVLLDHAGFTRRLEAAYRSMWTTWCGA